MFGIDQSQPGKQHSVNRTNKHIMASVNSAINHVRTYLRQEALHSLGLRVSCTNAALATAEPADQTVRTIMACHLEDVRLLADADLASDAGDDAALEQRPDGQEVVAHGRQAVAVVLAGVVVHQLALRQVAQVAERATMPAGTRCRL